MDMKLISMQTKLGTALEQLVIIKVLGFMKNYAVELQDISKTFPGVRALDNVSMKVVSGEVHALVGENGAGKSTLIKILAGVIHADPRSGLIKIFGEETLLKNPASAQDLGISVIYQEFNLLPYLRVGENIFLGRLPENKLGFVDWQKVNDDATKILNSLNLDIDPRELVIDLSVAEKQIVEIAKALSLEAKIIIMDEPSAVLAGEELEHLFDVIEALKAQGITVIYISHRLDEIFHIADRATVLKDGKVMGTLITKEAEKSELIKLMIGRTLEETFPKSKNGKGDVILEARKISSKFKIQDISFELHEGEVLGLAGLVGSGKTELARALFGIDKLQTGEILINGSSERNLTPQKAVGLGISLVPEDRKLQGLVLHLSIKKNISLPVLKNLKKFGLMNSKLEEVYIDNYIKALSIKTPNSDIEVQQLSGGNQQKVVVAKWLGTNPKVIILDEPTRGIDVGTKKEMYTIIRDLAEQGTGVIMMSSELIEILGMSDRILVMRDGSIAGELTRNEASEEKILRLAIGE